MYVSKDYSLSQIKEATGIGATTLYRYLGKRTIWRGGVIFPLRLLLLLWYKGGIQNEKSRISFAGAIGFVGVMAPSYEI